MSDSGLDLTPEQALRLECLRIAANNTPDDWNAEAMMDRAEKFVDLVNGEPREVRPQSDK